MKRNRPVMSEATVPNWELDEMPTCIKCGKYASQISWDDHHQNDGKCFKCVNCVDCLRTKPSECPKHCRLWNGHDLNDDSDDDY